MTLMEYLKELPGIDHRPHELRIVLLHGGTIQVAAYAYLADGFVTDDRDHAIGYQGDRCVRRFIPLSSIAFFDVVWND